MTFPNILEVALNTIPKQPFQWRKWNEYTTDSAGLKVNTYAPAQNCYGSIQVIPQSLYTQLGLDFEKAYKVVFTSHDIRGLDQQETPDMLIIEGRNWKVIRTTPWKSYNGWNEVLVVEDKKNVQN